MPMPWWMWAGIGILLARFDFVLHHFSISPFAEAPKAESNNAPIPAPPNLTPPRAPDQPDRVWQYGEGARCDEKETIVKLSSQELNKRAFEKSSLALVMKCATKVGNVLLGSTSTPSMRSGCD